MIKKYLEFIKEGITDSFGVSDEDIKDIMFYILDEFPEIDYQIDNSLQSSIIEQDDKSFIITLYDYSIDHPLDLPTLHHLEPKIHSLISDVDAQLHQYGLRVFYSDFGHNDAYYELVITKIGHNPEFNKQRYDKEGNPKEGWIG